MKTKVTPIDWAKDEFTIGTTRIVTYQTCIGRIVATWNEDCDRLRLQIGNGITYADHKNIRTKAHAEKFLRALEPRAAQIKTVAQLCKAVSEILMTEFKGGSR